MANKWLNASQYKKIVRFLGPKVLRLFALGLVVGLALFVVEVAFAYGLQAFLISIGVMDQSIVRLPWWVPIANGKVVLLFFFGVGTFRCVLQWAQLSLQGFTEEELRYLQRTRLLRWAFHSESVSSSQITILLNDRTNSAAALVQSVQILVVQLSCGLLLGLSLFYMQPVLTACCAVILAVFLLPIRSFDKKIGQAGRGLNDEGARVNRQILRSVKNLLLMQIYGTQKPEEEKAQERSRSIRSHHLTYYSYGALKFALPQFVGLFLLCIVAVISRSYLNMPPGKLISYFYLFVRFLQTISGAAQASSPVIQHLPQLGELAKWWADHAHDGVRNALDLNPEEKSVDVISPIGWQLRNVRYAYPDAPEVLFRNLNLKIAPGKSLVVTGPSGVGKSTLINLLLGSSKPQQGSIEIEFTSPHEKVHANLDKYRTSLLKHVGYVGAESFLIEGTVYENLIYGLYHKPDPQLVQDALKKAECQFILDQPQGLEHHLTEQGQGLSAGQKQRLSLARALIRKPKVLILDEATANLDLDTERKLVETLEKLKGEMTIIAVTHRQALLSIADDILNLAASASTQKQNPEAPQTASTNHT